MERNEAIKVVGFRLKVVEFCPKVVAFLLNVVVFWWKIREGRAIAGQMQAAAVNLFVADGIDGLNGEGAQSGSDAGQHPQGRK